MRTPINSIQSQILHAKLLNKKLKYLIENGNEGEKLRDKKMKVLRKSIECNKIQFFNTEALKHLVNDFLDLGQIKAGTFSKNISTFDLKDLIY